MAESYTRSLLAIVRHDRASASVGTAFGSLPDSEGVENRPVVRVEGGQVKRTALFDWPGGFDQDYFGG